MSCPRSHREWQSWKETRVSRPQFLCNKQESDTLQADAWAILNSLHFLFSHKDKPTLKWAAWGSCWWSQLMVTSFSVCWLITGISSCLWGWESRWFYAHYELTKTWGPEGALKVQIGSIPIHLEEILCCHNILASFIFLFMMALLRNVVKLVCHL